MVVLLLRGLLLLLPQPLLAIATGGRRGGAGKRVGRGGGFSTRGVPGLGLAGTAAAAVPLLLLVLLRLLLEAWTERHG